jgi:hypothetical protein
VEFLINASLPGCYLPVENLLLMLFSIQRASHHSTGSTGRPEIRTPK